MVKAKNNKHINYDFNVYAFMFNAFYFLLKKFPGTFCLAAFLDLFFVFVFLYAGSFITIIPNIVWMFLGLLVPHLVAGFYANKYMKYWKNKEANVISDACAEYLSIQPLRLLICSIISLGFYVLYWMYKNWVAIKKATKEPMMPVVRSYILGIFYIYPLLKHIKVNYESVFPKGKNLQPIINGIMLCIFAPILVVVPLLLLTAAIAPTSAFFIIMFWSTPIVCILLYLAFFILLMRMQQAINTYNEKIFPKSQLHKKFSFGEVVAVITGIVFAVILYNNNRNITSQQAPYLTTLSAEQQYAIGQMIGDAYRNIYGYKEVCEESGYHMNNYHDVFRAEMAEELALLNKVLAKDNLDIDTAIDIFIPHQHRQQIKEVLSEELQQITGSSEGAKKLACIVLDNQAENIVKSMATTSKAIYRNALNDLLK